MCPPTLVAAGSGRLHREAGVHREAAVRASSVGSVSSLPHPAVTALARMAEWPELRQPIDDVRDGMTSLRWHQALRRRIPEAGAESRVRGAQASGELDGARLPVDQVREYMAGVREWPERPDPVDDVIRGVIAATAASEEMRGHVLTAPAQALARLHVAAAGHLRREGDDRAVGGLSGAPAGGGLAGDERAGDGPQSRADGDLGRPRMEGEDCFELVELGPPPRSAEVTERLALLAEVIRAHAGLPAVVLAAVAHAEIAAVRPFRQGNGVVARALERSLVQATGLDPTGVAVTELGHFRQGLPAYVGALAAYSSGTREGVRLWLEHCCAALVSAADEGRAVADAVLAGRLPG